MAATASPDAPAAPTAEDLATLRAAGAAAYAVPGASAAPWLHQEVRDAIGQGRPVGDPGAHAIMRAWSAGWHAAADAAAWAAIAD